MPLDAITIYALSLELKEQAEGAKIDRVQQPEKDVLLLSLRTRDGNQKLLIRRGYRRDMRMHSRSI